MQSAARAQPRELASQAERHPEDTEAELDMIGGLTLNPLAAALPSPTWCCMESTMIQLFTADRPDGPILV